MLLLIPTFLILEISDKKVKAEANIYWGEIYVDCYSFQ